MGIDEILETTKTIAVVGMSATPGKAGQYVPAYLAEHGYRLLGVSPTLPGGYASLNEIAEPVDLVLLFRRSLDVPAHAPEILAMQPRPRAVWMQSGISHPATAAQLESHGIAVVQDRCMLVEHQRRN